MSESRIERTRTADLESYRDRLRPGLTDDCPKFLGTVTSGGAFPTTPVTTYLVNPILAIDSDDSEGSTPSFDTDTANTVPVVFLEVPSVGDTCICHSIAGRWVAEKSGSSSCCTWFCPGVQSVPSSITMTDPVYGEFTLPLVRGATCNFALDTHLPFAGADGCAAGMVPVHFAIQGTTFIVQINSQTKGSKSACDSFCPPNTIDFPVDSTGSCLTQILIPIPPAACNVTNPLNFSLSTSVAPTCGTTPNPLYVLYGGSCPSTGESLPLTWSFSATKFQSIGCASCCMTAVCACGQIPQGSATLTIADPLGVLSFQHSFSLTFAPGGPNNLGQWTSDCFIITSGVETSSNYWIVTCGTLFLMSLAATFDGSTPSCEGAGTGAGNISLQFPTPGSAFPTTTCTASPYSFSWVCPVVDPTGICVDPQRAGACAGLCDVVFTFSSNAMTPQAMMCQNFCVACPFTIPQVTVTVFASQGGMQLATGTINTPGLSCIFLSWPGQSGPFFYTANAAGYPTISKTASLTCGATTNIAFSSICLEASVTLTAISGPGAFNGTFDPITLTFSSGIYIGTFVSNKTTFTVSLNCSTGRLQITGPTSGVVLDTNCCTNLCVTAPCPTMTTFAQSPFNLVETGTTTGNGAPGGGPLTDGNYNVSCTVMAC
jgi:hypothetical protein